MQHFLLLPRVKFILALIVVGVCPVLVSTAAAAAKSCERPTAYKDGPIQVIVRFGPGGGADILARKVTSIIEANHPQLKFNVRDLPGGNSLRAVDKFMRLPADGHAILNTDATLVLAPLLGQTRYGFDSYLHLVRANKDTIAYAVRPGNSRFSTAKGMIKWAKAHPGKLTVSTTGILSSAELHVRYFNQLAGLNAKDIGYAKAGERRAAVIGGHVDVLAENLSSMSATLRDGKLKPVLILSDKRISAFPNVPTAKEVGIDYSWGQVRGYALKPGTPPKVANYLECVFLQALHTEKFLKWEEDKGIPDPAEGPLGSAAWSAYLKEETKRERTVLKNLHLLPG